MKRYLITGFSGFVSHHFLTFMEKNRISAYVLGIDINSPDMEYENFKHIKVEFIRVDLLDNQTLQSIITTFMPDYLLHLASYSSVAFSWQNPVISFQNNTNIFLNLVDIISKAAPTCRVLSIGSSEEYGNVSGKDIPLKETHPLNPISPYAVARVSQEMLSKIYAAGYGLDIIMTRSFNHIGPGQREEFALPSFVKQLVKNKKAGINTCELITGDVSIIRDFVDVRDVAAAYYVLLQKGKAGEVYNVCSGTGYALEDIIYILGDLLGLKITIKLNPQFIRPNDNKIIIGYSDKIHNELGWIRSYSFEQSLKDMIAFFENQ